MQSKHLAHSSISQCSDFSDCHGYTGVHSIPLQRCPPAMRPGMAFRGFLESLGHKGTGGVPRCASPEVSSTQSLGAESGSQPGLLLIPHSAAGTFCVLRLPRVRIWAAVGSDGRRWTCTHTCKEIALCSSSLQNGPFPVQKQIDSCTFTICPAGSQCDRGEWAVLGHWGRWGTHLWHQLLSGVTWFFFLWGRSWI